MDETLDPTDIRAMVRLLGETCAMQGTVNQKKHFLMSGLCRLIDVQAWAWVHAVELLPGKLPVYVAYIHGGFSEDVLPRFVKIQSHPDMAYMSSSICRDLIGRTTPLTRTLREIVPIAEFTGAEVGEEWRACGVYPLMLSFHPLPDGTFSGLALYRSCDKDLCTEREKKIAHALLSAVPWLHERQGPSAEHAIEVPQLSVRERLVLELLLQGYSRKAIAETMDISINTVAGYAKHVYAFFHVTSQAELINRFFL
jgi:DNA-binding CsgD family transcriptional regulator